MSLDAACVVVPTFNEAQNLPSLLGGLRALSPGLLIVVVDDASPDGTARLAESLEPSLGPLRVLRRPFKGGRGSAFLAGLAEGLRRGDRLWFVEMDADLSHDPAELPAMIAALERGEADVVVRSRYVAGATSAGRALPRAALSRLANALSRALLRAPLRDHTNGYRAYCRAAAQAVEPGRIRARGHAVLSEVACQLAAKGFRFSELPTRFRERQAGRSSLTAAELLEALGTLVSLRRAPFPAP